MLPILPLVSSFFSLWGFLIPQDNPDLGCQHSLWLRSRDGSQREVLHCILDVQTEMPPWNGCLHLSPGSESDIKSLKPVSDAFKWVKTLKMKSLPICCECLTVADLHVYPHEDPFTPWDSVKWLQGKWIPAREGINSLLEMLFMLFPDLNFPHLSHFQFLKEKNVGVWDVSGQSGSWVGLSSFFLC